MDVGQVLRMNGGDGDYSYSNNSLLQRKVISMTKPIIDDALTNLYSAMNFPKALIMADLGCSSGPNTLLVASELVKSIDKIRLKLGVNESPEIQIYLNDLPQNDFNTIFISAAKFQNNLTSQMTPHSSSPCYIYGVPGSFYTRLFLRKSVHFVYSSYSLMWLSKVPEMTNINKGNVYMSATSPPSVIKAYYEQFQIDFLSFLKCRAEEVVSGGRMVLTILGRRSDNPCSKECCYVWELLANSLKDMVAEGLIEEEKLDSFNIPQYTPSLKEVSNIVEKEGSFMVNRLEVISEVNWDASNDRNIRLPEEVTQEYDMAKCMRAVAEPLVLSHFGESVIDEVFERYKNYIDISMSREKPKLYNVTVSMTRKG